MEPGLVTDQVGLWPRPAPAPPPPAPPTSQAPPSPCSSSQQVSGKATQALTSHLPTGEPLKGLGEVQQRPVVSPNTPKHASGDADCFSWVIFF